MARCCADLNRLAECEALLTGCRGQQQAAAAAAAAGEAPPSPEEARERFGDAGAFALRILAGVFGATERRSRAAECERRAIRLNPLLWGAFQVY